MPSKSCAQIFKTLNIDGEEAVDHNGTEVWKLQEIDYKSLGAYSHVYLHNLFSSVSSNYIVKLFDVDYKSHYLRICDRFTGKELTLKKLERPDIESDGERMEDTFYNMICVDFR